MEDPEYILPPRKVAVKPFELFQEGLDLIKDQYWLFLGMTLIAFLIGGATMYVLFGPMICGLSLALVRKRRGEPVVFDQLWKGMDFMNEAIIVSVILLVSFIVSYILFYVVMGVSFLAMIPLAGGGGGVIVGALLMVLVFGLFLMVIMMVMLPFLFAFNLIAERGQKGPVALGLGFKAMMTNLGGCFALQLVNVLFFMIGYMVCCVGQILVAPVYMAAVHLLYARMFPREEAAPPVLEA